jgi:2-keto-4-pentenoate hydratase/2-oxohepta-3-ene-1,7-dioic acid hydratase in catechol pathway
MKLISLEREGHASIGVLLDDDKILPVDFFSTMLEFLESGDDGNQQVRAHVESASPTACLSLDDVRLLAPLRPVSIRDCMAFEQHIVQATRAVVRKKLPPLAWLDAKWQQWTGKALIGAPKVWYEQPLYYTSNPKTVIGSGETVRWPSYTKRLDFELEWAVVIGKTGRDIPREKASDYIAGYTIFNDFSARDVQMREMKGRLGPAKGKNFDTGNAIGPWLVTADEIENPYQLTMAARINGETWCEGNTSSMFHRFEDIIAHVSQDETLYPGELIGSGTVGGGCGLEIDRWIQPGDVVELEVQGLGILRNEIGVGNHS